MLAAPLLAGNDIRAAQSGDTETWVKPLADGGIAVALFNKGERAPI